MAEETINWNERYEKAKLSQDPVAYVEAARQIRKNEMPELFRKGLAEIKYQKAMDARDPEAYREASKQVGKNDMPELLELAEADELIENKAIETPYKTGTIQIFENMGWNFGFLKKYFDFFGDQCVNDCWHGENNIVLPEELQMAITPAERLAIYRNTRRTKKNPEEQKKIAGTNDLYQILHDINHEAFQGSSKKGFIELQKELVKTGKFDVRPGSLQRRVETIPEHAAQRFIDSLREPYKKSASEAFFGEEASFYDPGTRDARVDELFRRIKKEYERIKEK